MALMRGSGGVWVARPVHTALLAVCASLLGLHAPVAAQTISVFGARSILQYNAENDRSFGGWRLGLALGAGEELGLQVSGGYWSDVRGRKDLGGADGRDFQAVVRYGLIATPRATVALEAGLGGFRGPEPVGGTSGRPVGRLVIVGLSVLAVPVWPFGLELGGYFRDDVGSFDLEGRVGVRAFLRREKGGEGGGGRESRQPRASFGTARYYRLGGTTSGDGLGVGVEFENQYRGFGALVGIDIVPVRTIANNQNGGFDYSMIVFWGGPRLRAKTTGRFSPFVTAGPVVTASLEGPLNGLRPGGGMDTGVEYRHALGKTALVVASSARLMIFDGVDAAVESALVWRFSVGLQF